MRYKRFVQARTWLESVREAFTLAEVERWSSATPRDVRERFVRRLAESRQAADAAETLRDQGHPAEALSLARRALLAALEAVDELAPPSAAPRLLDGHVVPSPSADATSDASWERTLLGRGMPPAAVDGLRELAETARHATPAFDGDVTTRERHLLARLLASRVSIDRAVHASALEPAQIHAQRRNRVALVALVVATAVVALVALAPRHGDHVRASGQFGEGSEYAPERAVDGNPATEWLLPDHAEGELELRLDPPRRVEAVELLNAHNPPYEDRGVRAYTIELWVGGELARRVDGHAPFSQEPAPMRHAFGVDRVERVRVLVHAWHHLGGGLAEVRVE